jgi:hypothetical protein
MLIDKPMIPLNEIFDVQYGNSLELNSLEISPKGADDAISFVSRTRENNGISAIVKKIENIEPFEAGLITVAGSGNSVLESFIQPKPFYTGYHVFVLKPKKELTDIEQLYYCYCIRQNQYKYNYGRQANRTIKDLLLPSPNEIPDWVYNDWGNIKAPSEKPFHQKKVSFNDREWAWFPLKNLFPDLKKCRCSNASLLLTEGDDINYIGAKKTHNGVMQRVKMVDSLVSDGNTIVFIGDGAGSIGYVTYQKDDFIGSSTLTCGYNKHLNEFTGLFLVTILDLERYRFSFGRKYGKRQIENMKIKLPSTPKGDPDWQFMEYYIKSLPYSSNLRENRKNENGKGLSDVELIEKYETGEKVDFNKAVTKMAKSRSNFSKKKATTK